MWLVSPRWVEYPGCAVWCASWFTSYNSLIDLFFGAAYSKLRNILRVQIFSFWNSLAAKRKSQCPQTHDQVLFACVHLSRSVARRPNAWWFEGGTIPVQLSTHITLACGPTTMERALPNVFHLESLRHGVSALHSNARTCWIPHAMSQQERLCHSGYKILTFTPYVLEKDNTVTVFNINGEFVKAENDWDNTY